MPRPRKDGAPAARAIRIGVERTSGAGKKWRVRSYAPTDSAPYGRVVYVKPTTGRPTSAVPTEGQTLDELFDQVESALTQKVAMGTTVDGDGKPDPGRRDVITRFLSLCRPVDLFVFVADNRISGDGFDGTYQATTVIPRYSALGTWQVCNASVQDAVPNYASLTGAELPLANFTNGTPGG